MNGKRQKIQCSVALEPAGEGEAFSGSSPRAEPFAANPATESPASAEQLMEEGCSRENLEAAWKRVRRNKGGPGVDGMTIDAAKDYLREQWPNIRSRLLDGTYQPQPVKRVEIPKPDGGVKKTRRAMRRRQTDRASLAMTCFTEEEREALGLVGLVPEGMDTETTQVERVLYQTQPQADGPWQVHLSDGVAG